MPFSYKLSPQTLLLSGVHLSFINNTGKEDGVSAGARGWLLAAGDGGLHIAGAALGALHLPGWEHAVLHAHCHAACPRAPPSQGQAVPKATPGPGAGLGAQHRGLEVALGRWVHSERGLVPSPGAGA